VSRARESMPPCATNETADPQQPVALRSSMDLSGGMNAPMAALRWVDALHIINGPPAVQWWDRAELLFELDSGIAGTPPGASSCPSWAAICCTPSTPETASITDARNRSGVACLFARSHGVT